MLVVLLATRGLTKRGGGSCGGLLRRKLGGGVGGATGAFGSRRRESVAVEGCSGRGACPEARRGERDSGMPGVGGGEEVVAGEVGGTAGGEVSESAEVAEVRGEGGAAEEVVGAEEVPCSMWAAGVGRAGGLIVWWARSERVRRGRGAGAGGAASGSAPWSSVTVSRGNVDRVVKAP